MNYVVNSARVERTDRCDVKFRSGSFDYLLLLHVTERTKL